jgi:hypothetical protein
MRSATHWIGAIGVSLTIVSLATAQPPQRGQRQGAGGGRSSPQFLLANEDVQNELKLTDEQKEKIKAFAPAQGRRGGGGAGGGAGGARPRGDAPGGGQGGGSEAAQAAEKFVKESLTAEQQKRFKQIRFHAMGVSAFGEEEVQSALKFSDDQKSKAKTLVEDFNRDSRELMPRRDAPGGGGGGNPQEIAEKRAALVKSYTDKVHAMLSDEQKKAWKDLVGAPFELRPRRPAADR